jgi:hypothetical protein
MTSISEAKMPMTAHIWPRPVIEHREEGSKWKLCHPDLFIHKAAFIL